MVFLRARLSQVVCATSALCLMAVANAPALAQSVVVQGAQRVDPETIRSYFTGTDQAKVNQGVKDLYATGLFADVKARRDGGRIVVSVRENNVINRVAFEGNSKLKSDVLLSEVQSKSRGAYSPATVQADIERIREIYRRGGRAAASVNSRLVDLPNGRVDVVFTINEGDKTGVKSIEFAGNQAYGSYRLRNLMQTTEMNLFSFFKSTDVYDPDKIASDQEAIRRFYLKNGYADFRIVGSDVRYDEAQKGYNIVITVDEGQQYRVANVSVDARLRDVDPGALQGALKLSAGDTYNGDLVEKSVESVSREVARRGYAFSQVRPRGDRDPSTGTINLSFVVEEGPRVYVERIVVSGNTRTRDYVVRREFDIGEGDAYNRALIDRAERRLNNLGFFKRVKITNVPGSAADRVVVVVDVEDQPTGSFGISGGYSTVDGFIAEVSVTESNFLGRGQYARAAATLGQHTRGIDLSFTEPYFMDTRMSGSISLFSKQTDASKYALYKNWVTGGSLALGVPITDEITFSPRYSAYLSQVTVPNSKDQPYNDCNVPIAGVTPGTPGSPYANPAAPSQSPFTCVTNGEASLAIQEVLGKRVTSSAGYSLSYNSLDNIKNPTSGLFAEVRQDVAGLGGNARFVRSTGDVRYYYPIVDDVVGILRGQAGNVFAYGGDKLRLTDNFNLGPSLVRGFAPGGIGPRDMFTNSGLGGTNYLGASAEVQFPIFGLPKELGLRGALFADAGTLFGYKGRTSFSAIPFPGCGPTYNGNGTAISTANPGGGYPITPGSCIDLRDSKAIRTSVGASLLWSSPLGPIRFDYAFALSKGRDDVTQAFRFSGGSSF